MVLPPHGRRYGASFPILVPLGQFILPLVGQQGRHVSYTHTTMWQMRGGDPCSTVLGHQPSLDGSLDQKHLHGLKTDCHTKETVFSKALGHINYGQLVPRNGDAGGPGAWLWPSRQSILSLSSRGCFSTVPAPGNHLLLCFPSLSSSQPVPLGCH